MANIRAEFIGQKNQSFDEICSSLFDECTDEAKISGPRLAANGVCSISAFVHKYRLTFN